MSDSLIVRSAHERFSRRAFIEALSAGTAAGFVAPQLRAAQAGTGEVATVRGAEIALRVGATPVNFTGTPRIATVVNDSLPAPLLRWREGDTASRFA